MTNTLGLMSVFKKTTIINEALFPRIVIYIQCTGCPKKNIPLGEGQTSPKGTFFFWDTWYIKCLLMF